MQSIFDQQYELILTETIEIRTRTETRTRHRPHHRRHLHL